MFYRQSSVMNTTFLVSSKKYRILSDHGGVKWRETARGGGGGGEGGRKTANALEKKKIKKNKKLKN